MAYCTSAHVRLRLPEFPSDVAHEAIVAEAISAAQAEVDMALGARYTVPFTTVPDVVRHITADLAAAWALDTTYSGGGEENETRLSAYLRSRAMDQVRQMVEGTWRGADTLVARSVLAGSKSRPGMLTSTRGTTPALRDWVHPGLE